MMRVRPPPDSGNRLKAQARLRLLLGVCIIVPILLFVAAAWQDYNGLLRKAEANAHATATTLREHALKAIATHEILLRQLDRRIQGLSWAQIRETAPSLSAEMRELRETLPDVANLGLADKDGLLWIVDALPGSSGGVSITHLISGCPSGTRMPAPLSAVPASVS